MYRKILHGLDGSHHSFMALVQAIDLARQYDAELHTISVEEVPRYDDFYQPAIAAAAGGEKRP